MPDQEARNDGEGEVGYDAEDAVNVAEGGNDRVVNAFALLRSSVPHEGNGVALEEADEEECSASNNGYKHSDDDDPVMMSLCGVYM